MGEKMKNSGKTDFYGKGKRNYRQMLLLAAVFWLLAGVCVIWYRADVARIRREKLELYTVLHTDWGKFDSVYDHLAWVDITKPPVPFLEDEETGLVYAIVTDGERLYVAELDYTDAAVLAQVDYDTPRRLEGMTGEVAPQVQQAAMKALQSAKGDEAPLTMVDEDEALGGVCLRVNQGAAAGAGVPKAVGMLLAILGLASLADAGVQAKGLKHDDPRLAEGTAYNIKQELNSPTARYFPQEELYLTDHYLVNCKDTFCILDYHEITGIQPQTLRIGGVVVCRYLMVFTQDGTSCRVATLNGWGKKPKQELAEIQAAIQEKCPQLRQDEAELFHRKTKNSE